MNSDGIITKLHIFSDGAGSQFKNRFTLSNMTRPQLLHPNLEEVDWSFFGTAHGKGPVDGVGGTVKRAVWRRILQRQSVVSNAEEFAEVAKVACPNIAVIYVPSTDVKVVQGELEALWNSEPPKNIPKIREQHYFRPLHQNTLEIAPISPFSGLNPKTSTVIIFESTDCII